MTNLDKRLKRIEKNKETENEVKTYPLTIGDETFDVKTMTRKERRDFYYAQEAAQKNTTFGEIVKKFKPIIYRDLELAPLAVKAKDAGHIASYYDVVEAYFEPDEILEIVRFITEINEVGAEIVVEEIEELKKQ